MENRGRPKEAPAVKKEKYTLEYYDVPTKPELGWKSTWYFDDAKTKNGAWKVEHTPPKGWKAPKIKAEKGKAYAKQPVVMVFKTSNRSNAKIKMKVWKNENIDYIISSPKLPGIPSKAVILELGVGKSFIDSWRSKYNL
tara:strand:- start:278 stop:694 length:417 start_codon:yes stop_codon:yes gene_type:complete